MHNTNLNTFQKGLLFIGGTFCLTLGIIGIFLPLLPTTPFLLLAAGCYMRSSDKFYNLLIHNKYLGSYIENYRSGKGIPLKTKIFAIVMLWFTIGLSVVFIIPRLYLKLLLLGIAMAVTYHICSHKTLKERSTD